MAGYQIAPVQKKKEDEGGMGWLGTLGLIAGAAAVTVATAGAAAPAVAPAVSGAVAGTAAGTAAGVGAAGAGAVGSGAIAGGLTGAAAGAGASTAAGLAAAGGGTSAAASNALKPSDAARAVSDDMGSWDALRRQASANALSESKSIGAGVGADIPAAETAKTGVSTWESLKRGYGTVKNLTDGARTGKQLGDTAGGMLGAKVENPRSSETTSMPTPQAGQAAESYGQPSAQLQKAMLALKSQSPEMQQAYGPTMQEAFNRATKRRGMA